MEPRGDNSHPYGPPELARHWQCIAVMTNEREIEVDVHYDAEFNVVLLLEEEVARYLQMAHNFSLWEKGCENEVAV